MTNDHASKCILLKFRVRCIKFSFNFVWILLLCPQISNTKCFWQNHLILCFAEGQPSMWNSNTREKPTNMCQRPTLPPRLGKKKRNQKKTDYYLHCAFSRCKKSVQLLGLSMGRILFFQTFLPHNKLIFIEPGSSDSCDKRQRQNEKYERTQQGNLL